MGALFASPYCRERSRGIFRRAGEGPLRKESDTERVRGSANIEVRAIAFFNRLQVEAKACNVQYLVKTRR